MSTGDWLQIFDVIFTKLVPKNVLMVQLSNETVPYTITSATSEMNIRFRSFPNSLRGVILFSYQTGKLVTMVYVVTLIMNFLIL